MIEEWRSVNGFENLYEVSNVGRVRSLDRIVFHVDGRIRKFPGRTLTCKPNKRIGYVMIQLHRDNKGVPVYVHRLVAQTFLPIDPARLSVNHRNGIRYDNRVINLEWCMHSENTRHAYATNLVKYRNPADNHNAKFTWQAADELRSNVQKVIDEWCTKYGVVKETARSMIIGRTWRRKNRDLL